MQYIIYSQANRNLGKNFENKVDTKFFGPKKCILKIVNLLI